MGEQNDFDWLPVDARQWAGENNAVLEIVARELVNTGHWPSPTELTRRLARQGRPIPVADLLWRMPRMIGFIDTHPGEVVILLQGLRMTGAGRPLLDGFMRVLRLAVERYASEDPNPVLRRADMAVFTGDSDEWVRALSEVVLREAPFLGSGTGSVDDEWSREITDGIVRYWNVQSPDDYLRTRAGELRAGAALGWGPIPLLDEQGQVIEAVEPPPVQPADLESGIVTRSDDRDAFISHAGEDLGVAEGVGRLLTKAGWNIWLDKLEMTVGDTLTMALNDALARSRFGVVVLSPAFFAKHWPKQELAALAAKEAASGTKVILPVWHGINEHYLAQVAPMLANRIGVSTGQGLEYVAAELIRALEKSRSTPSAPGRAEPVVQSVLPEDRIVVVPEASQELAVIEGDVSRRTISGLVHDLRFQLYAGQGLEQRLRGAYPGGVTLLGNDNLPGEVNVWTQQAYNRLHGWPDLARRFLHSAPDFSGANLVTQLQEGPEIMAARLTCLDDIITELESRC